jgi:hypothetical protein
VADNRELMPELVRLLGDLIEERLIKLLSPISITTTQILELSQSIREHFETELYELQARVAWLERHATPTDPPPKPTDLVDPRPREIS